MMKKFGFTSMNNTVPTRVATSCSSLIDLVFTNHLAQSMIGEHTVDPMHMSDHDMNKIILKTTKKKSLPTVSFTCPVKDPIHLESLNKILTDVNTQFNINEIEDAHTYCSTTLANILQCTSSFPTMQVRPKTNQSPWVTHELIMLIREKKEKYKKAKKTGLPSDWQAAKNIRNKVNYRIVELKKEYFQKKLNPKNPKESWKIISMFLPEKNGTDKKTMCVYGNDGNILYDNDKVANHFNNYFTSTVSDLMLKFQSTTVQETVTQYTFNYPSFSFSTVTSIEIDKCFGSVLSSSSVLNSIPTFFIKQFPVEFGNYIKNLINVSFNTSTYPDSLKNMTGR
jgi:hypothetical protein